MLTSQLLVIIVVLALAAATFAWLGARTVTDATETRALSIARTLASESVIEEGATRASSEKEIDPDAARSGDVQALAQEVASRNSVEFVVVTNDQGLRIAHPDQSRLGKKVSTSPDAAL